MVDKRGVGSAPCSESEMNRCRANIFSPIQLPFRRFNLLRRAQHNITKKFTAVAPNNKLKITCHSLAAPGHLVQLAAEVELKSLGFQTSPIPAGFSSSKPWRMGHPWR